MESTRLVMGQMLPGSLVPLLRPARIACTLRCAHSIACFALLASLARSAALSHSLARSFTCSGTHGKEDFVYELNASIPHHLNPQCHVYVRFAFG